MKILLSILLFPLSLVWNGFVFTKLWVWFVAPTFDLPILSIPTAIGIQVLIVMLFPKSNSDRDTKNFAEIWLFFFAFPLVALVIAWIVLQFN